MDYYKKVNFVDGILWINLDRSTERRTHMEDIFKNIDIPNTRIQAIDGKNEDITKYVETVDWKLRNDLEIACTLSHLKAINQLKHMEGNYFLILEDDINFDNMKIIPYDFEYIIKGCPDFDVLKIYKTLDYKIENNYEKFIERFWGTCAYIISRQGINKLTKKYNFDNNILQNKMSEVDVSDKLIFENCNTYTYKYNCIDLLDVESLIHPDHQSRNIDEKNFQNKIIIEDFNIDL